MNFLSIGSFYQHLKASTKQRYPCNKNCETREFSSLNKSDVNHAASLHFQASLRNIEDQFKRNCC